MVRKPACSPLKSGLQSITLATHQFCSNLDMKYFLLLAFLAFSPAYAQTFSGTGGAIPDNGPMIDFPLQVSGVASSLDTTFGLAKICFSVSHHNLADLQMFLVSPSGKVVFLFDGVGYDGNDFTNTCLGGRNYSSIFFGSAPFSGNYCPMQSLGHQNNGQSANGIWKLRIRDKKAQVSGQLLNWSITFSNQPVRIFPFSSSNLPLVLINTQTQIIPDEPKLPALLKIISQPNEDRNAIADSTQFPYIPCGIEQRGSSSSMFPKKSYGIEFQTPGGTDTSLAILGIPAQSDWVLAAGYSDKSLMRNTFAYNLSRQMGWYAPRTRYVEVMLNDEYQGIYVLTEKIKRDANRVDISKLKPTDISGPNLSGGYIIKIDKTTGNDSESFISNFPPVTHDNGQVIRLLYDYPKAEDLVQVQKNYIKAYIDSFETALHATDFTTPNGYRRFANVPSFIDYFIVNEWSKNVDGYRFSTYLTKPKITQNGGKLIMGPVWDYDIAWRNADYCNVDQVPGWSYRLEDICPSGLTPTWWHTFRTDPQFNNDLKCRWMQVSTEMFTPLKRAAWVDSVKTLLAEAQQRNFTYWPILGEYVWPNPLPLATNYAGEVAGFQNWLNQRASWITSNLGGTCITANESITETGEISVFPNPGEDEIQIAGFLSPCNSLL